MNYGSHWLLSKHNNNIQVTTISSREFRLEMIPSSGYPLSFENTFNSLVDWDMIADHNRFRYDFLDCGPIITKALQKSKLANSGFLLVEVLSDIPVLKVDANYFISNWEDFERAACGMGMVVLSINNKLLMEFTDDYEWQLFSNFIIKISG
jgi:hypothetical protein